MESLGTQEMLELMQKRHSVRQYVDRAIEQEKRAALDALVARINWESDLHIQIFYDEPKCFDSLLSHYGKFSGVKNYIALVGTKSPQLEESLGYYGEKLVLKAQSLGLNTCWVALTHGKSAAEIKKGEKLVCLIALGYGATGGVPHKDKPLAEVCNYDEGMPKWFSLGVRAALMAPTAMNQQKFRFELGADESVKVSSGSGFYTKMDMGIVKYHFEAVTGRKIF